MGFEYNLMTGNVLISMYTKCMMLNESLQIYIGMLRSGMEPNEFVYTTVLRACAYGREIYGRVIKCGMDLNSIVSNSMIDMYCKCGAVKEAEKVHERMNEQTLVSWNAVISGYSSRISELLLQIVKNGNRALRFHLWCSSQI